MIVWRDCCRHCRQWRRALKRGRYSILSSRSSTPFWEPIEICSFRQGSLVTASSSRLLLLCQAAMQLASLSLLVFVCPAVQYHMLAFQLSFRRHCMVATVAPPACHTDSCHQRRFDGIMTAWPPAQVSLARGLRSADLNGLSDPYCIVRLGKNRHKTQVEPSTLGCSFSDPGSNAHVFKLKWL